MQPISPAVAACVLCACWGVCGWVRVQICVPLSWVPVILKTSNLWKRRKQSGIGPEKTNIINSTEEGAPCVFERWCIYLLDNPVHSN
jgi:hypothetical protein